MTNLPLRKSYEIVGYITDVAVQCVDCTHHLFREEPIFLDGAEGILCDVCGEELDL